MGVALHAWDEKSPSRLCRRGRTGSRGCTIRLCSSSDPCGSQKSYMQRFDLCMSEKASNPRGRRRRNKNRDVRPNRHPRGQTYCCSSTFNPSRPRNEHPVGVRILARGEYPPIRTCKRGRGTNRKILHVWLNRRADGLTGRHCDTSTTRMSLPIDEKKYPAGVRLLLGNHPPSLGLPIPSNLRPCS